MLEQKIEELTAAVKELVAVINGAGAQAALPFNTLPTDSQPTEASVAPRKSRAKKEDKKVETAPEVAEGQTDMFTEDAEEDDLFAEEKPVTLDDIRVIAQELVKLEGNQATAASILSKHGVTRLNDIATDKIRGCYNDFAAALTAKKGK